MSDIKKTALIILIIVVLSNTFTQYAYASNDRDHDELMQYEGYGKAVYDSVVEQTTYITGQYSENKDFVSSTMDEIKGYADFWYNEYNDFTSSCYQSSAMNCLGEMVERGGAYVLTLGDWIKNLFTGYEDEINPPQQGQEHPLASYFVPFGDSAITTIQGYHYTIGSDPTLGSRMSLTSNFIGDYSYTMSFSSIAGYIAFDRPVFETSAERDLARAELLKKGTDVSFMLGYASQQGVVKVVASKGYPPVVEGGGTPSRPVNPITKYINENGTPEVVVPEPAPFLVCPDGKKIQMSISGSTFIAVNGEIMLVNKDGTAEVNGSICNLGWQKPDVDYTPDGKVVVTQPDGTKTDLETNDTTKPPVKVPEHTDLEGCEGVLCGIGKVLDGLGSVVSSIAGMVKDLLEGLVKLFVPDDLSFMKDEFSRIMESLNKKIPVTNDLKEAITSLFDGGGGNPLADISLNLPITNEPLNFGNVSFIEEGVPILRKVISAIVALYTIVYVYRKITGRGGVMER